MFNRSFHNLFMESMILGATLLASTSAYAEDKNLVAVTGTQTNIPTALNPKQTQRFGDNSLERAIAQTPNASVPFSSQQQ